MENKKEFIISRNSTMGEIDKNISNCIFTRFGKNLHQKSTKLEISYVWLTIR